MHLCSPSEQIKTLQFAQASAVTAAPSVVVASSRAFVALNKSGANEENAYVTEGVLAGAPKATGEAWAIGAPLYWDASNSCFTTTPTSNTLCGNAASVELSAATTGKVAFNSFK